MGVKDVFKFFSTGFSQGFSTRGNYPSHYNYKEFLSLMNNTGFKPRIDIEDRVFIDEGYASNIHLYAIIKKLVDTSIPVPYKIYYTDGDAQVEDTESDLYKVLNNPNPNQTLDEFKEEMLVQLALTGDLFLLGQASIGFGNTIQELSVLRSDITDVLVTQRNNEVIGYQYNYNTKQIRYDVNEVYHAKLYNPTNYGCEMHRGMSPLQAGYRNLVSSNELMTAESSFYKNKGVSGIVSSDSDMMTLQEEEAEAIDEVMRQKLGGSSKSNGVVTTGARIKYTPIGMSPSDLDMIKSGDVKLRNLCIAYGMDSKLFGDPKASTYNNVQEVQKQLYTDSVIPFNTRVISALNRFLVPSFAEADNRDYKIKLDTSDIEALQQNQKEKAEKNKVVIEGVNAILTSAMTEEGKAMMLSKLYDIQEDEASILIQSNGTTEGQTD